VTDETKALPAPKPVKTARIWPLWIVIAVITVASGALFFYGWHQLAGVASINAEFQQMHQRQQQLQQTNDSLAAEVRNLGQQKETLSQNLSREQAATNNKLGALSAQLLQMGGASRTEWLLAEAEYLLRLANQRLNIEKDVAGTVKVLETADTVLAEADDAGLYPVRKQLRDEILSLQLVSDSDLDGIYLQLEAIINSVDRLEQVYFLKHRTDTTEFKAQLAQVSAQNQASAQSQVSAQNQLRAQNDTTDALPQTWGQKLLAELNKLIVFKKLDAPVEPLLSPEQTVYLKQNMRLLLEQAQLALLKKNQRLYEANLNKALAWIGTYFPTHEKPVQVIQEQMQALATRDIDPKLPEISGSLSLLKQRIQLLYRQHALPSAPTTDKPAANEEGA
jgi:uroporphyrin-3 C-methyltransferase